MQKIPSTKDPITLYQLDERQDWDNIKEQISILPSAEEEILPGVQWGCSSTLFTPAYWKVQYLFYHSKGSFDIDYKLGRNLLEEVVACILGGFGLKSEIGLLANQRMVSENLIRPGVGFEEVHNALLEPFIYQGKKVHYRFPNQKSKFIHLFLNRPDIEAIPKSNDLELRNWLLTIKGIGPKTASWITRNYMDSKNVAIIDIHIYRAGIIMGLFPDHLDVNKEYFKLEKRFIQFCEKLKVEASKIDALIWLQMKESNHLALNILNK